MVVSLVITGLFVAVVAWRVLSAIGRIDAQLIRLDGEMRAWQHAHDHQLMELHRWLGDITTSMTVAGSETQAVSHQLVELSAMIPEEVKVTR